MQANNSSRGNVNIKNVKINQKSAKMLGIGLLVLVVLVVGVVSLNSLKSLKSEEPDHLFEEKAGQFYLAQVDGEDYYVSDAVKKAMVGVKWEHDLGTGVVTITGKDKKTKDEIVMKFLFEGYSSFISMTRAGKELNYTQWFDYLMSY